MKDAYYFKHDSNARHDPKIKALIKNYGIEGYGRFWIVLEAMRAASNYKLEDKEYVWLALAEDMNCSIEQVKTFIQDCIENFSLFYRNDNFIYSESFLVRMIKLEDIRMKRSLAGKKRWEDEA